MEGIAALQQRLSFNTQLPQDVAAAIHGRVGRASRRAVAAVSKAWKGSVELAKSKGLFRLHLEVFSISSSACRVA